MALPSGAHVRIGGVEYRLDEGYEQITGRRCYVHGGRLLDAQTSTILGSSGQNLREDRLLWHITQFAGEGQVVLDTDDPDSASRFYRSEGLDFRIPGQGSLNKSALAKSPQVSAGGTTTYQGNADFTDISGTSTTQGTNRKLVNNTDQVGTSSNYAPGLGACEAQFYLFRDDFAEGSTTIEGTSLITVEGETEASGNDLLMRPGSTARSPKLDTGTDFEATANQRVHFFLYKGPKAESQSAVCYITDVTHDQHKVLHTQSVRITNEVTPTDPSVVLHFDPQAGHSYRIYVQHPKAGLAGHFYVDKIVYGAAISAANNATIEVWNQTASTSVATQQLEVHRTAADGIVGSIAWTAAAATNYRFRVKRNGGKQAIWVDKVTVNTNSSTPYTLDILALGLGAQTDGVFTPKIWLAGHASASDSQTWVYNPSTDVFERPGSDGTLNNSASTTNATIIATANTDSAQYFLLSTGALYSVTAAGVDTRRRAAAAVGTWVGMTIAQERLFLMYDTSGQNSTVIRTGPLDITWDGSSSENQIILYQGIKTPDSSLRQRMCGTPTGARFFTNYGDISAKIYEVSVSEYTIESRQIADLGMGVKATCIAYESGLTFIGGVYYGDPAATDTDKMPKAALWVIDQNGVLQRIGFFRRDDPDVRPPQYLVPYQQDLYILQGPYIWRYSLVTGGLFCEYELPAQDPSKQRGLATLLGQTFATYEGETFVTGSVGTYRQSSVAAGSSHTSSITDFAFPGVRKALVKVEVLTDEMPANTQVVVEYQIDQSGTWVQAGSHITGTRTTMFPESIRFETLQVRTTLVSLDGTATPTWRATVVEAKSAIEEEYFDLVLRCEDEDSSDHIAGGQYTGAQKAESLVTSWRSGMPVTFVDGYDHDTAEGHPYVVTIDTFRDERNGEGEGRVVCSLKVVR